jgi:hypothetical protein
MSNPTVSEHRQGMVCGSVWYQEPYFLDAVQQEIDTARYSGAPLCVVVLQLPDFSRRAARQLYAYAEAEDGDSFFGLLSNGDCAICMPGCGYTEGTLERVALARDFGDYHVSSGLAVLDQEQTAADLLQVAVQACLSDTIQLFETVRAA